MLVQSHGRTIKIKLVLKDMVILVENELGCCYYVSRSYIDQNNLSGNYYVIVTLKIRRFHV